MMSAAFALSRASDGIESMDGLVLESDCGLILPGPSRRCNPSQISRSLNVDTAMTQAPSTYEFAPIGEDAADRVPATSSFVTDLI
jgi:hypothetical protein